MCVCVIFSTRRKKHRLFIIHKKMSLRGVDEMNRSICLKRSTKRLLSQIVHRSITIPSAPAKNTSIKMLKKNFREYLIREMTDFLGFLSVRQVRRTANQDCDPLQKICCT